MRYTLPWNSLPIFPWEDYPEDTELQVSILDTTVETYHNKKDFLLYSTPENKISLVDVKSYQLGKTDLLILPDSYTKEQIQYLFKESLPNITFFPEYHLVWQRK